MMLRGSTTLNFLVSHEEKFLQKTDSQ
jgi:hypothetical protein